MRCALRWLAISALWSCTVVQPNQDGGNAGKVPGEPFENNACFRCTLAGCSTSANACLSYVDCSTWLQCVGDCPTATGGVSVDLDCLGECAFPVSAQILAECIENYSAGVFRGCEAACAPLPRDAGTD